MTVKTLKLDLFPHRLLVFEGEMDVAKARRSLIKNRFIGAEEYFDLVIATSALGRCWSRNSWSVIWVRDPEDIGSLAHEAVHAGMGLADFLKTPQEADNDEFLAYYVQWVVKSVMKKP